MPQLSERITLGWKEAMKSGDHLRRDVLSGLRAALKNQEINARGGAPIDDAAEQAALNKEGKKRRESIEEYEKAGRPDLAEIERQELSIIAEFLPTQLGAAELEELVRGAVAEAGATSPRDMGRVMALLVPRIEGRADGKEASALVKKALAPA